MFKFSILKFNINNLDTKIFILLLYKFLFTFNLKKKLILKPKSHLIIKFKKLIKQLNYKKYNE